MDAERPLLLLHVFATFAVGGPQMRFAALANRFGPRYRHIVVAMDGDYACAKRLAPTLDVRCEPVEAAKGATIGNVRRFRRLLRNFRPDVLITYNWGSVEWAMANTPRLSRHIHIEDGFGPEERSSQIRRRVLTRRLVLSRSTVVVPSRTLWRIATEVWRLHPRRVQLRAERRRSGAVRRRWNEEPISGECPVIEYPVAALRGERRTCRA